MRANIIFKYRISSMDIKEQLETLNSHLAIVKKSPADKIDDDFYNFMLKAKDTLG